jgi:hypothetical protein
VVEKARETLTAALTKRSDRTREIFNKLGRGPYKFQEHNRTGDKMHTIEELEQRIRDANIRIHKAMSYAMGEEVRKECKEALNTLSLANLIPDSEPIGYTAYCHRGRSGHVILCVQCMRNQVDDIQYQVGSPIYIANVAPYMAVCIECGVVLSYHGTFT